MKYENQRPPTSLQPALPSKLCYQTPTTTTSRRQTAQGRARQVGSGQVRTGEAGQNASECVLNAMSTSPGHAPPIAKP